jgi:HK97 family phage portal protein
MKILGFEISLNRKAALPARANTAGLATVPSSSSRGGWFNIIRESFAGAWQRNVEIRFSDVLTNPTIFACVTTIANDIAKLCLRLMTESLDDIWVEAESSSFSPVIRRPNHFQNRIQFYACWIVSKLLNGNTYVLKIRDSRQIVIEMYVLDPNLVTPLVAPDGEVFYQLQRDDLAGVSIGGIVVPATEIIHDRWNCLFHPLVGLSPIFAAGFPAVQANEISRHSTRFFRQGANPGGILTAPGEIDEATAVTLKKYWEENYTGDNAGRVAVLGDGLKYEKMSVNAVDSQLVDQLKWSDAMICNCFRIPGYMIGVGALPSYNNVSALNQQYYSQCLQIHIESIELGVDEGLSLPDKYGVEFDLDGLIRMDTASQIESITKGIAGGLYTPNEARKKVNLKPLKGGDTVYLQDQDVPMEISAQRTVPAPVQPNRVPEAPPAEPPPAEQKPAKMFSLDEARHIRDKIRAGTRKRAA